jgi:hypothetical protein
LFNSCHQLGSSAAEFWTLRRTKEDEDEEAAGAIWDTLRQDIVRRMLLEEQ